ncbi:LURP-one-related family protein [Neobacillus sp. D3-1R]|uniref:LURP-one-related family protein n=1 Tax=Neobacillus sp. D3-1R TaxID=3445778 RepID=UPI003FA08B95
MDSIVYFQDNFFSAGTTEIFNESKNKVGELDLKSMFSASVEVLDNEGNVIASGKFPFMGMKWRVYDGQGQEIGALKQKLSFFSKRYEYQAEGRGYYYIESEAFSKQYDVYQDETTIVATFHKISGFFSSPAFQLTNHSDQLSTEELIAVVMGVNAIQRRNSSNAAATT